MADTSGLLAKDQGGVSYSVGCFKDFRASPSTVPFLFLGQVAFMIVMVNTKGEQAFSWEQSWHVYGLLIVLGAWGLLSSILAAMDVYKSENLIKSYPAIWIPLIPLVLIGIFFAASKTLRYVLGNIASEENEDWFVFIQGFRVFAVGTVMKASRGTFPKTFGFVIGVLDMLYGISAWILFIALKTGSQVSTSAMFTWHLLGILIIVPPASIVMQLFLPGLFFTNESEPPMISVFDFPMVLGPSLVVPVFVGLNLLMVWQLGLKL